MTALQEKSRRPLEFSTHGFNAAHFRVSIVVMADLRPEEFPFPDIYSFPPFFTYAGCARFLAGVRCAADAPLWRALTGCA